VESVNCVVSDVREPGHTFGDCKVVFNPSKPKNHDVDWAEGEWRFADRGDFGGYADKYDRLDRYVAQLKVGRK